MFRRPIPLRRVAKRDVYLADYTINGHRVYYAVDSRGELAGMKTVAPGEDPEPKIQRLWTDLDRDDPITPTTPTSAQHLVTVLVLGAAQAFPHLF